MATSPKRGALLAAAALAAGIGLPALAQQQRKSGPESILPPGFGEPSPPPPTATPTASPTASVPQAGASPAAAPSPGGSPSPTPTPTPSATPSYTPQQLALYEMPLFARRSLAAVGTASTADGGYAPSAFGSASGHFLETLMRRLDAPLPSRWLSIDLRRLLASQLSTPTGLNGADFAAERAWLLLRMGESVTARALVQGVDTGNYTPKLDQVAMQAALATGDPEGICPVAAQGRARFPDEAGWALAQPICAALAGEPNVATPLLVAAQRHRTATGVDLLLAEKVVGAGAGGRRAVNEIDWGGVDRLTAWRFGLASATGVAIPDELLSDSPARVIYWRALSPMLAAGDRIAAAEAAAAQGVISNLALVDLFGAFGEADDRNSGLSATAHDLATAYTGARDARLSALGSLWDAAKDERGRYARLVLTARAAAGIAPQAGTDQADRLVGAMLSAGLVTAAERWQAQVAHGSDAWAMLMLANTQPTDTMSYGEISAYTGDELKRRMFFAGLAGLGRLSARDVSRGAEALDVRIGLENSWTRALDQAVARRQPGTVLLLAAVGMQTPSWRGVAPAALYRVVAALHAVGLDGEARMLAAEPLARL